MNSKKRGTKDKDAKKREMVVDNKDLVSMTDDELIQFQKDFQNKLRGIERNNAVLETEFNMLRNAWNFTEDKVSELELENVMIRRELDLANQNTPLDRAGRRTNGFERSQMEYNRGVMYENIENVAHKSLQLADESNENSFYNPHPSDEEQRFAADARHIEKDLRLKRKKDKLREKIDLLSQVHDVVAKELVGEPSQSMTNAQILDQPAINEEAGESHETWSVGTISTGSVSNMSEHVVMDRPNVVDNALNELPSKARKLKVEEREKRNLVLLKERKWKRTDPRYDDFDECRPEFGDDSDDDHIFDDFNPIFDEDVDDAVEFYQMKKWLEYDSNVMVEEMSRKLDRRMKAISRVWAEDVKRTLCDQLSAAESYNSKLRATVDAKIEKEKEKTQRNEEYVSLIIQGLEDARKKAIRERIATNMSIKKQQTDEHNFLLQESYDRAISEIKSSAKFNFDLTQKFFMTTTENDISLVHELHAEEIREEEKVKSLEKDVETIKKELALCKKPLELERRNEKLATTTAAALMKDMKSKKAHEMSNAKMIEHIEKIENDTDKVRSSNFEIAQKLKILDANSSEIAHFHKKFARENTFNQKVRAMTAVNETKLTKLRAKVVNEFQADENLLKMIDRTVLKNVARGKHKKWHNLLETKAFNELITQFGLRARHNQMDAYVGIDKLEIPYRKTSANIITTFVESEKFRVTRPKENPDK